MQNILIVDDEAVILDTCRNILLRKNYGVITADSVDNARDGAWIEDSEGLSRQALDRFRQQVYEATVQARIDAAEAAFPPSEERKGNSGT